MVIKCKVCGEDINKDENESLKSQHIFGIDVWRSKDGEMGHNEPYHWHEPEGDE